ncbi:acetyltransferase [Leptospira sp. 201903075]|uniref:acetyltransferase n=1 Tax=Leptospira chreensis TaxID=2810035 RepID=UPI0019654994|nr:acetyltransferase [Leptospira chreensis]MBM9589078.1 acetyltransferase [Leptospira chreensis]
MNEKKDLILVGAGGHAASCVEVIEAENRYRILGFIGMPAEVGKEVLGYPVIGSDKDLNSLNKKCKHSFVCIGQIESYKARLSAFNELNQLGFELVTVISPTAIVSRSAKIGKGTIICHSAILNSRSVVGENCIINTGSIIEHDVVIGNHNHISTGTILNGGVRVGNGTFIGSGTVIREGIHIGSDVFIGMSNAVTSDIEDETVVKRNGTKKT